MSDISDKNVYQDCLECGREFYITPKDQRFFRELAEKKRRPFHLPKRCYECRKRRREQVADIRASHESNQPRVWRDDDGYQRRSGPRNGDNE